MAKSRKPVSVFGTSKKELEDVSKQIMAKTAKPTTEPPRREPEPENKQPKPQAKKTTRTRKKAQPQPVEVQPEKKKILYLSSSKHQEAKINAARRGMKLHEYAEWLVSNDTEELG